jgi:hypothetical protein
MGPLDLSPAERDFFVKLCGMLGSDQDGERAAAAAKASNFLRQRTLTWSDVVQTRAAERSLQNADRQAAKHPSRRSARSIDWRADLAMCRKWPLSLTGAERDLIASLEGVRRRPTVTEVGQLARAATRLRTDLGSNWSAGAKRVHDTAH